ncbi:MAG: thioredoxin family protein [Bacillota bacterium]
MDKEKEKKPSLFVAKSQYITNITEDSFDQLTFDNSKTTLVMFGAERCAQCNDLYPVINEIAEEQQEKIHICWVDVDQNKPLVQRLRIRGIPNLLLFKDGAVQQRMGGAVAKEDIMQMLMRYL